MKMLLSVAACLCVALNVSAFSTSMYVQDGLIACWDGIENAGAGTHSDNATVWKDVVGGYSFTLNNVTVDADRMTFAGSATSYGTLSADDTIATFGAAANGTLEIVYASRDGTVSQMLLQTPPGIGLSFGELLSGNNHLLLPFTGTTYNPEFVFASGTATNSVSVRYASGAPTSASANGLALARSNNGYWSGTGDEAIIGTRSSKENYHFPGSIYCIRLYSRRLTDGEIAANYTVDQLRFMLDSDSVLLVSSNPALIGSPSPAFGLVTDIASGDTREVSCGATVCTNAVETVEYRCVGWRLYDMSDVVVASSSETSFTYTHPTPAGFRRLEWQWKATSGLGLVICVK